MKIETRFKPGDKVFILDDYKIIQAPIISVYIEQYEGVKVCVTYGFTSFATKPEMQCFGTKEELINYLLK